VANFGIVTLFFEQQIRWRLLTRKFNFRAFKPSEEQKRRSGMRFVNQIVFRSTMTLNLESQVADSTEGSVSTFYLKSNEFSSVFLRALPFGDGRRPIAL
jgi:hypothetical protein